MCFTASCGLCISHEALPFLWGWIISSQGLILLYGLPKLWTLSLSKGCCWSPWGLQCSWRLFSTWESDTIWWHSFSVSLFNKLTDQNMCVSHLTKAYCQRQNKSELTDTCSCQSSLLSLSIPQAFLCCSESKELWLPEVHSFVLCGENGVGVEGLLAYLTPL